MADIFVNSNGGSWFTASNWSGGVPTSTDDATINGHSPVFDDLFPVEILGHAAVAQTVTVTNNVLNIGGAFNTAAGSLTATAINLDDSELLIGGAFAGDFEAAGQLTLSDAVHLFTPRSSLVFNTNDTFTFSANITDLGSVLKDGSGVVTLTGTSGYTGSLTIASGAIHTTTGSELGNIVIVDSGASLQLQGSAEVLVGLILNGNGLNGKGAVESLSGSTELGGPQVITLGSDARINSDFAPGGDDRLSIDLGQIVLSGHTLTLGGGGQIFCNDAFAADSGGLTIDGGTNVTLVGLDDDLYTGATTILSGVLALNSVDVLAGGGAVRVAAQGVLAANTANAIGSLAGSGKVTIGGTLTVGGNGLSTSFSGVIGDGPIAGKLFKIGTGVLALSGDDTFTGGTEVQSGVLRVLNAAAVGAGGSAVTVDSGASLQIAGGVLNPNQAVTINGAGAGGFGALRDLSGSGSADELGDISLGSDSSIACQSALLQLTGIFGSGHTVAFSGGGATQVDQFMLLAGGGVSKSGFGSVVLGPNVSYSGATLVSAGLLDFRDTAVLGGAFTVAGGALEFDANQSIASLAGAGKVLLRNGAALTVGGNGQSTTFAGVIAEANGSAALKKTGAGALTLRGVDSYSGLTTISAGVLALAGAGSLANSAVAIAANARLDISGVTAATSLARLSGEGASSVVSLGGKSLTVTHALASMNVEYLGKAGTASHLAINVASANFSLATTKFGVWTTGVDTITITGNSGANVLTGSNQTDSIFGGAGDDTLNGGAGWHFLDGGAGADKLNGTGGISAADYADATAGATVNLLNPSLNAGDAHGDTYVAIHRVVGSAFADKITADNSGDRLNGGNGADTIVGGGGVDFLLGGMGADKLTGGGGADLFTYTLASEGGDVIADFSVAQGDVIEISHSGFGGGLPSSGALDAAQFVNGTHATSATGQFLWDATTSTLGWDVDGTGVTTPVAIAKLTGVTTLTAASIHLF